MRATSRGKRTGRQDLVLAAGGPATAGEKSAIAARAAIDDALARLRGEAGIAGGLLIAPTAFRAVIRGDRDHQLRSARSQIAVAREAPSRHPGDDVAFIAYTPSLYRIFLEAQRQAQGDTESEPVIHPGLERAMIGGECVLVRRGGLSRGAGLPDWGALVARMAGELGVAIHEKIDDFDLAQWYRGSFGGEALARLIRAT